MASKGNSFTKTQRFVMQNSTAVEFKKIELKITLQNQVNP